MVSLMHGDWRDAAERFICFEDQITHHLFAVLKKAGLILPNGQTFLMQFFCSCLLQVGESYRCSWQARQAQVTWQAYCTGGAPLAVGTATRHAAGPATAIQ